MWRPLKTCELSPLSRLLSLRSAFCVCGIRSRFAVVRTRLFGRKNATLLSTTHTHPLLYPASTTAAPFLLLSTIKTFYERLLLPLLLLPKPSLFRVSTSPSLVQTGAEIPSGGQRTGRACLFSTSSLWSRLDCFRVSGAELKWMRKQRILKFEISRAAAAAAGVPGTGPHSTIPDTILPVTLLHSLPLTSTPTHPSASLQPTPPNALSSFPKRPTPYPYSSFQTSFLISHFQPWAREEGKVG